MPSCLLRVAALLILLVASCLVLVPCEAGVKPNFLVVLTDDQDYLYGSHTKTYMPALDALVRAQGLELHNFIVSTALCCPARMSLFTGRLAHNNNLTSNHYPTGGFGRFAESRLDSHWLPSWLKAAGYFTAFNGKFLNGFNSQSSQAYPCPRGWDKFDALIDQWTYDLFNPRFKLNCGPEESFPSTYQTSIMTTRTKSYISDAVAQGKPFFAFFAPAAPHTEYIQDNWVAPRCAPRHNNLSYNAPIPKKANYYKNPAPVSVTLPSSASAQDEAFMKQLHNARLKSLRAIDESLDQLVAHIKSLNQLPNTYIIFMSDNGYHIGAHNVRQGKSLMWEEDVRVPFLIAGPDIAKKTTLSTQASSMDFAATVLALAGVDVAPLRSALLDGMPLPVTPALAALKQTILRQDLEEQARAAKTAVAAAAKGIRESIVIEYWGDKEDMQQPGPVGLTGHAYKAVRICTSDKIPFAFTGSTSSRPKAKATVTEGTYCAKYILWCNGAREVYDLSSDPWETKRLTVPSWIKTRLDALLAIAAQCKGADCRNPLGRLHPRGDVTTLQQALDPAHDSLYRGLDAFQFAKGCSAHSLDWSYERVAWLQDGTTTSYQAATVATAAGQRAQILDPKGVEPEGQAQTLKMFAKTKYMTGEDSV